MAGIPVGKRAFDAFVSHAHVDKRRADEVCARLSDIANVPVWYDAVNMPPGATIAEILPDAIENSRSLLHSSGQPLPEWVETGQTIRRGAALLSVAS